MGSAAHEWSGEDEDLDPAAILAALAGTETRTRQAELDKLVLGLQWCAVNPATEDTGIAEWGFAPMLIEIEPDESPRWSGHPDGGSVRARVSSQCARGVDPFGDAADRGRVGSGASVAVDLSPGPDFGRAGVAGPEGRGGHALVVPGGYCPCGRAAGRPDPLCGDPVLKRLTAEAAAKFEPAAQETAEEQAIADSGVELREWLGFGYAGTSELHATGDTVDLTRFHDYLNELAAGFAAAGDTTPLGVRQILALRFIAGVDDPLPDFGSASTGPGDESSAVCGHQPTAPVSSHRPRVDPLVPCRSTRWSRPR